MTADPGRRGPAWGRRRGGLRQVLPVRLRHVGPAERIQMLTVGGRVLRVATRDGDPGRPPLLLCSGIGGRLELFQPFVDVLDPRRAIIRFDMPGIGESPAPVVPYHLATVAPMLTGLLDQLGVARADVLGISWGGGLAQEFALSRPDRVHRLVLVATGPGALMVPGHPKVLLRMLTPRRHATRGTRPASQASCTAAACGRTRRWPGSCWVPRRGPARPGATTTSSSPASAGPAFPGCASCGRPR